MTILARLRARIAELESHCERLGQGGAERYWEARWRDEKAENDRLRQALGAVLREVTPYHPSWRIWDRIRAALDPHEKAAPEGGLIKYRGPDSTPAPRFASKDRKT